MSNHESSREFDFTQSDFTRIRQLIYRHAGISLSEAKTDMVYSRIARRLRTLGYYSFKLYLDDLEKDPNSNEWELFTNALTTNLTSFFREEHHFNILKDHLLTLQKPIRIWCSAASTGEEPYSIAMSACEAFNTLNPPVEIIATDIDTNVLKVASQGVYPVDRVNKLSDSRLKKYFLKGKGAQEGQVRIRPELIKLITFHQLNLLDRQWPMKNPFDVIFCRNVMIYFDKKTQGEILEKFVPLLKPNSLLFAGHSENFMYVSNAFQLLGKTVYQLKNSAPRSLTKQQGVAA